MVSLTRIAVLALLLSHPLRSASAECFEIDLVDSVTGRGVPLVELETVDHVRYITDSGGRVALCETGYLGQTVFFYVRSHGYEFPKDGFGIAGARIQVLPGRKETLKIVCQNIAERLYRNTGQGIYRDTILLSQKAPISQPLVNAQVAGQDSIQRALYNGKIYWFWGDTLRVSYPLGNFRMSGAVSELPSQGGLDPVMGVDLRYFSDAEGFARGMFPLEPKGDLIWADGFMVLPDGSGRDRMIAHYLRLKGLGQSLGSGLAIYNDAKEQFEQLATLDLKEQWRFPHGHPISITNAGSRYFYFGAAFPTVRVRASTNDVLSSSAYEAFTCLADGTTPEKPLVHRDPTGRLIYRWTKEASPATPTEEKKLIAAGLIRAEEAHFQPVDVQNGSVIQIHAGTVAWNPWRERWILIAVQQGGTSMLGEVWYSEAEELTGPWRKARKIVTHDQYSFYNPAHHPFFDQDGGRIIYFEGTYTADFSGNTCPTPRYNYNQVMYRLDLSDPRLKPVVEEK
jgi:hypothetical protein